nr:GGDEF domain-containing protein [Marichromatium bheemlicum]
MLACAVRARAALRADRRARLEQLQRQARSDGLTGLANRIAFEERTDLEIGRAARHQRRFALCLLDLDGFKAINDRQGHLRGDEVLCDVADVLAKHLRNGSDDLASRFGGDEFGLLLCELTELEQAQTILADLCRRIAAGDWDGQQVTVSIGVAFYPDHATSRTGLLRAADVAMYRAKMRGKNCVVVAGGPDHDASSR